LSTDTENIFILSLGHSWTALYLHENQPYAPNKTKEGIYCHHVSVWCLCVCLCVCVSVCCWPKFWRLTATYWRNHFKRTGKYQMANNSVNHWLLAYVFNKFGESDKQRQRSVYMCCGNILRLLTFRQNWRQNYSGTFYFRTRCRRHRHLRPYFAFFTFTFICQEWYAMCYNKTVIGRTSQAKSSYICCSKICSQTMNVQFLHRLMRIVDVWEAKMDD